MFRDEGLEVELIRMNANVSVMALSTLDTDYTVVFASVVRGARRGMPMKVVASYMDSSTHLLIARELYKMPFTGLGAHTRKIKEKPDEVKRMIKTLLRTNRYVRQNREARSKP
jgi:ABC-type nitrate/sulfonate/bicarbonate transport system substrate-binding protein